MAGTEIELQRDIFIDCWNKLPETRFKLFHVVNEGKRSVILTSQLLASGMIPGIPDLLFLWAGVTYYFELKAGDNDLSTSQRVVHAAFDKEGMKVFIIRDKKHAFDIIKFIIENWDKYENFQLYLFKCFSEYVSYASQENLYELYLAQYNSRKKKKYYKTSSPQ